MADAQKSKDIPYLQIAPFKDRMLAYLIDWLVIMGAHLLVWPVVLTYVALNIADYLSFLPIASTREFLAQHIKQSHRPILHIGHSLLSRLPIILVLRDLPSSLCLILEGRQTHYSTGVPNQTFNQRRLS